MRHTRRLLLAALLGALVVAGAGRANAEPTVAQQVCTLFEEHGVSMATADRLLVAVSTALGISYIEAAQTINASVQMECPEFWSTLVAVGDEFRAQDGQQPEAPLPATQQRPQLNYAV